MCYTVWRLYGMVWRIVYAFVKGHNQRSKGFLQDELQWLNLMALFLVKIHLILVKCLLKVLERGQEVRADCITVKSLGIV